MAPSTPTPATQPTPEILAHIVGERPYILKVLGAIGVLDLVQGLIFGFSSENLAMSAYATLTMLALEGVLLSLLWYASRAGRVGMFLLPLVYLGLAVPVVLFVPAERTFPTFLGMGLAAVLATLAWHPKVSQWLKEAAARRAALPVQAHRQLAKMNMRFGLALLLAPLFALKAAGAAIPLELGLVFGGPGALVGLGILAAQGLQLWKLPRA